jgi:uncharacterized membrane protein
MAKDDEFLKEFFVDCQNGMRWHSETEWKLLNLFMILHPVIVGATLGMTELTSNRMLFLALAISMAVFLTVLTILLTVRVVDAHKYYETLGRVVVKIWEYFGLFEEGAYLEGKAILEDKARRYGTGKGHRRTLHILWGMTGMTDVILMVVGLIAYLIQS